MLDRGQVAILGGIGVMFWLADVAWIRFLPLLAVGPSWGDVAFPVSVPVAWLCVRLARTIARLDRGQLVSGITVMVAAAALLHGMALRWIPGLYGSDQTARLGGAWLLWVYGLIFGCALLMALRPADRTLPDHA